ncbi:MAG: acetyltransferase [Pseudomonadota bacterium]
MADVIVFGVNDTAQLAQFYLREDSEHRVVAFTVDTDYLPPGREFMGLPVVPFEQLENHFPPDQFRCFAPMTGSGMNRPRADVYHRIRQRGYRCISYISSRATVWSDRIGENVLILEDNTIQPFVTIGNNVSLWSGNHIGHHSRIGDHVTVTSHAVVSGHCDIGDYSFLGVNCTLRDGLKLAEGSFIAMSASLVDDTEAWCAYAGQPAQRLSRPSDEMKIYHNER